jgi:hypothetical protein
VRGIPAAVANAQFCPRLALMDFARSRGCRGPPERAAGAGGDEPQPVSPRGRALTLSELVARARKYLRPDLRARDAPADQPSALPGSIIV